MAKYKNAFLERLEEEEAELKDLENDSTEKETPAETPEEETWKKRHGDLRRHSQKQVNDLSEEVKTLKEQLADATKAQIKYPKSEEEVSAWMEKYPDVAKIVQTIAMQESNKTQKELNELRELSKQEREEIRKEKAYNDLLRLHPDFEDIRDSEDFQSWIRELDKDHWVIKALYENNTDVKTASQALSYYKDISKKYEKREDRSSAARDVPRSHANAPTGNSKPKWSESLVESLSAAEYEKYEDEIMTAMQSGKFTYDLTGGAR